jgi:hypothetical protein
MDIVDQILSELASVVDNLVNIADGISDYANILESRWEKPQTPLEAEIIEGFVSKIRGINIVREQINNIGQKVSTLSRPEIRRID